MDTVQNFVKILNENEERNKRFIQDATKPFMDNLKYMYTLKEQTELQNKQQKQKADLLAQQNQYKKEQLETAGKYRTQQEAVRAQKEIQKEALRQQGKITAEAQKRVKEDNKKATEEEKKSNEEIKKNQDILKTASTSLGKFYNQNGVIGFGSVTDRGRSTLKYKLKDNGVWQRWVSNVGYKEIDPLEVKDLGLDKAYSAYLNSGQKKTRPKGKLDISNFERKRGNNEN